MLSTKAISYKNYASAGSESWESKGNFYSEMQRLTKAEDTRYVNIIAKLCYYTE